MLTRRAPQCLALSLTLSITCLAGMGGAASAATAVAAHQRVASPRFAVSDARRLVKEVLAAWQITKGQGVTVALIGSGIDAAATGLGARLRVGPHYGSTQARYNGVATDMAMDIAGGGPTVRNVLQSQGLAPQVHVLVDEVSYNAPDQTWQQEEASALGYAVAHGASVVYLDEEGGDATVLDQAVADAQAKGAVLVANNYATDRYEYPAALPGVLTAGAVDVPGLLPPLGHLSQAHDQPVLVATPANTRLLGGSNGLIYPFSGDEPASMWLVAVAALIKSVYPHLSPALVQQALALSANDRPLGGYNATVGFGLINPEGALDEAAALSSLRVAAAPAPGVAGPGVRLASGPPPGVISDVHHSLLKLAGFGGLAVLGLVLLALAASLARRRRPAPPAVPDVWPGVAAVDGG
ncbi:MAG TPA: S8 family serine peptidase [Streptosporangiaceae bacterium]|nr:S8 family serine peptidase [Streptosporangiaceae bacterium]